MENYYYSCTYDLTNTLARNMVINSLPLFSLKPEEKLLRDSIYSD